MTFLIIDNYDSFTFNLYQMMQAETDQKVIVKRNDALSLPDILSMALSGIVLSPGPGHPANASDFGVCKEVIENAATVKVPVLGVCLGHQGIGHYMGGTVQRAPQIIHGKMSTVECQASSALFAGMPKAFPAMRYHSLIVEDAHFPDCLEVTAREQHGGLIMALQHKTLPLFGVQFHPESIGTPDGKLILRNFIGLC